MPMHNLDQTLNLHEAEYELNLESESEQESEQEGEYEGEYEGEQESAFSEMEQLELAAELLEVNNEQELENFLGDLIKKAGGAVSNFAKSDTGKALGGILKKAAKKALPIAGGALGGFIGGPIGAKIGSFAADKVGQAFGLELEGLSYEDREFEVAQQFVKLAGDAAQTAASAHGSGPAPTVAKAAFIQSAQAHAPGLIRPASNGGGADQMDQRRGRHRRHGHHHGVWRRRGDKIVLLGVGV